MKKLSVIMLLSILCAGITNLYAGSEFKFIKKNGATHLYERWINVNSEQVRELKAVFTVNSNIENIIRLLQSSQQGTKWQTKASSYSIKMLQVPSLWVNYIHYDLPAVVDDQDCLLLYSIPSGFTKETKSCEVWFNSTIDNQYPVKKGIKRISGIKGSWKLEQQNTTTVKITYTISSDRDKSIPRFISDPIIHDNIFTSMSNFKNLLEK